MLWDALSQFIDKDMRGGFLVYFIICPLIGILGGIFNLIIYKFKKPMYILGYLFLTFSWYFIWPLGYVLEMFISK